MTKTIKFDTIIMGVYKTLEEAQKNAEMISAKAVRIVELRAPMYLSTPELNKVIGYLCIPSGYACFCCGQMVGDDHLLEAFNPKEAA